MYKNTREVLQTYPFIFLLRAPVVANSCLSIYTHQSRGTIFSNNITARLHRQYTEGATRLSLRRTTSPSCPVSTPSSICSVHLRPWRKSTLFWHTYITVTNRSRELPHSNATDGWRGGRGTTADWRHFRTRVQLTTSFWFLQRHLVLHTNHIVPSQHRPYVMTCHVFGTSSITERGRFTLSFYRPSHRLLTSFLVWFSSH